MSQAYVDCYSMDRPKNELGGKDKDLALKMRPQTLEHLESLREMYKKNWVEAYDKIKLIANNKRIKNKQMSFDVIVARDKNYFNFRAIDYYLYRLGFTPQNGDMYDEGIEYQLYDEKCQLERTLFDYNMYHGFNMIHWLCGDGSNEWFKDGEPDWSNGKDAYTREDLGIFYY